MKLVANILQKLGISQRSLANFIDANHATLSRYESATRSLPTDNTLQLALMQQMIQTLPTPSTATPSDADIAAMQQKAQYCLAQCYALQKQLT